MARTLSVRRETWPLAGAFRISRGSRTISEVIVATIDAGGTGGGGTGETSAGGTGATGDLCGRGECYPYARYGESLDSVEAQIRSVAKAIADGAGRDALLSLLPAGAARNAVDCALWDLEAKTTGKRVWELAGIAPPAPTVTVYTLGAEAPHAMAKKAAANRARPRLKLKMVGDGLDIERIEQIHKAAPESGLVVDANEGWTAQAFLDYAPRMADLGVEMIEQPLPAGADAGLDALAHPIPICADESCHDTASLAELGGKYDMINIKLDKTGGLTEALRLRAAALAAGYGLMVGCMVGTSLAMAPALLVAAGATVVDLDGPLLLAEDRAPGLIFRASTILPPPPEVWG